MSLFAEPETIDLGDGLVRYWPAFLDRETSKQLFDTLRHHTPWEQTRIRIAGRIIPVPRLNAWYGDGGAVYGYSGAHLALNAWTPALDTLRAQVMQTAGVVVNSALLNLYRNGSDSVDWHSDDEPELGQNPVIASVSLGAVRRFDLRHRADKRRRLSLHLADGVLLVMSGALQHHWHHRVPKEPAVDGERINITFRLVQSGDNNTNKSRGRE